jgi:hypothetical protein
MLIDSVSKETVSAMGVIFNEIKTLGISFRSVNQVIEGQAADSTRTLFILKNVQEMTDHVRTGAEAMNIKSTAIHNEMGKLREISTQVTEKVAQMREANTNIAVFLDKVQKIGVKV